MATGKVVLRINPKFYRPAEVDLLVGNPEKAGKRLGWRPEMEFDTLVETMAKADYDRVARGDRLL